MTRGVRGCGPCAGILVDFEPPGMPDETEILCAISDEQLPSEYIPALEQGIREGLGGVAAAVLVTNSTFHEMDSSEWGYRIAGREAGRAALIAAGLLPEAEATTLRWTTWPGRKRPRRKPKA
ncbi:hypothetical protein ACL02S_15605 [Nocardia sp. 004]|uniref:hypothetical protein n=1 Tax=Nocardia sp. 004 TaxID=3385978 RepID=UPI0039A06DD3